jgi:hypothetical protein
MLCPNNCDGQPPTSAGAVLITADTLYAIAPMQIRQLKTVRGKEFSEQSCAKGSMANQGETGDARFSYLPGLDGLRVFPVIAVLLYHAVESLSYGRRRTQNLTAVEVPDEEKPRVIAAYLDRWGIR